MYFGIGKNPPKKIKSSLTGCAAFVNEKAGSGIERLEPCAKDTSGAG